MCVQFSFCVLEVFYVIEFLVFLGFDFEKDGVYDKDLFVVFFYWDFDGILVMML